MASPPRPRYRLVLASLAVIAAVGLFSFVTPWALWVLWILPLALIIGICAWRGMTLAETWQRLDDESPIDGPARGPAGFNP